MDETMLLLWGEKHQQKTTHTNGMLWVFLMFHMHSVFFCLGADEPAGVEEADLIGATTQRFFGSHHGETQRYTWYPGGICLG